PRGQPDAVEDDQHGEVGEGEALLNQEEVVVGLAQRLQAAPHEQQLAGKEEAEEEGGYDPAEDQVAPVGGVATAHLGLDVGRHHFRAKGISRKRPPPLVKSSGNDFLPNELTCLGRPSRITVRGGDWRRKKPVDRPSVRNRHGTSKKGGESQMLSLYFKLRSLTTRQEGQGMVEYALILVLVSIVVIVILLTMGNQIKNVFSNVVAALGA